MDRRHFMVLVVLAMGLALTAVAGTVWGQVQYTVTDLGWLPGCVSTTYANGVNDYGQVVGDAYNSSGGGDYRAFLYGTPSMTAGRW